MSPWVLSKNFDGGDGKAIDKTYERPLGLNELGFYWDHQFNNTADTFEQAVVETAYESIISDSNVSRAWLELKQCFPLLGAKVFFGDDSAARFLVSENHLNRTRSGEIRFDRIDSVSSAGSFVEDWVNGKISIPFEGLSQLVILTGNDSPSTFHVTIRAAHSITDGIANISLMRNFLHILTSTPRPTKPNIGKRLSTALSSNELSPVNRYNIPRQRWRRAIASVLFSNVSKAFKGGHTLPRNVTTSTHYSPAVSRKISFSFTRNVSHNIFSNCRKLGFTFGNAHPVLCQVALTKLLFKRRFRGEIDDEEWEFRKREPLHTAGPLNLRPYLDRKWFENGGGGELNLCIGFFNITLPHMPIGATSSPEWGQKLPNYADILSQKRFIWRCQLAKQKLSRLLNHPLYLEMGEAGVLERVERGKSLASRWKGGRDKATPEGERISVIEQARGGYVLAHGGSSLGNLDLLLPESYPIPPSNPLCPHSPVPHPMKANVQHAASDPESLSPSGPASLRIRNRDQQLHCRPSELYLGAFTSREQLHMEVFWDVNVYNEETIKEWLDEVRGAVVWYLGCSPDGTEERPRSHKL